MSAPSEGPALAVALPAEKAAREALGWRLHGAPLRRSVGSAGTVAGGGTCRLNRTAHLADA